MRSTQSTLKLVTEQNVDIYKQPSNTKIYQTSKDEQLTMGDLHANAIKLLFFLYKHNIIEFNDTKDEKSSYDTLVEIYNKLPTDNPEQLKILFTYSINETTGELKILPPQKEAFEFIWKKFKAGQISVLNKQDLDKFSDILTNKITIKNIPNLIRLMGDETADRGACDLFVLYLLLMMHIKQIPYEILLSNHSLEFILAYEKLAHPLASKLGFEHMVHFTAASMLALQILLDTKLVTKETLFYLLDTVYKPYLKLLSYSLSEDGTHISIFSHAAIGLGQQNIIKALALKLGVTYDDTTAIHLAETIDRINDQFQQYASQNKISTLVNIEMNDRISNGENIDPMKYPIEFMIWNRSYDNLERPAVVNEGTPHRYTMSFNHAHDSKEASRDHINNTDNLLGKRGRAEILCALDPKEQEYTILRSTEKSLSNHQKKANTISQSISEDTASKTPPVNKDTSSHSLTELLMHGITSKLTSTTYSPNNSDEQLKFLKNGL